MKQISRKRDNPTTRSPGSEFADSWEQTPTLLALRRLLTTGVRMRHTVARRAGLSDSELATLEHLSEGALGPGEVARRLEVSTAASTGIVDRLARRGHVARTPHPVDRRRTEVALTPSGRAEVLDHLLPVFIALARLDAGFDDAERAVVERYLRGAIEAFDAVIDPGSGGTEQREDHP